MKHLITLIAAALLVCGFTACTTTKTVITANPDGTTTTTTQKVPDPAKTEQVKALAKGVVTSALTEAYRQFPKDADQIALYARAAGGVFCTMSATKEFSPEVLESAIANLVLPQIKNEDTLRYVQLARNALLTSYEIAYSQRFNAELKADDWPLAVCEIFCSAIDQSLKDAGRPGVK